LPARKVHEQVWRPGCWLLAFLQRHFDSCLIFQSVLALNNSFSRMRLSCVCLNPSLSKQHGRVHLFALCGRQVHIQHGQVCLFLSHAALFHCISRQFSLISFWWF
jgi:hypothetical protein